MAARLHLFVLVLIALPLTRSQYSEESQQCKKETADTHHGVCSARYLLYSALLAIALSYLSFLFLSACFFSSDKRIYDGNIQALEDEVMAHPDLEYLKPASTQMTADSYSFFNPQHFRVGLLIDPCRGNSPDCCMNSYGSPEYPSLITSRLEAERFYKPRVIGKRNWFLVVFY